MLLNLNSILLTLVTVVMRHVEPSRGNRKTSSGIIKNITLTIKVWRTERFFSFSFSSNNSVGYSLCHADAQLCKTHCLVEIHVTKARIRVMNASILPLAGALKF